MIKSLHKLFENIELDWIDSYNEITVSEQYFQLISIFPNLKNIFQEGNEKDKEEFQRTIRHIFRLFKIYFLIIDGEFSHDTLSHQSINIIREKLLNHQSQNELILPIILMYHDIGRLEDKKDHPSYGYHLISEMKLLDHFDLIDTEKTIINKIIQYHLLFATIYTGESTFYGVYSLLNDTEFNRLLDDRQSVNRFIDILEIFTYIDILGYSYARIYDHYVKYYEEINNKLNLILNSWPDKEKALKLALEYSQEWLEWRIAGALRIFQYIETQPYLTEQFYFKKIRESINKDIENLVNEKDWDVIQKQYLADTSKIQMKYGLAMLMLLAFRNFFRGPIKEDVKISSNLIIFWLLLSNKIRSSEEQESLWNIHFIGLPNWWKWDRQFKQELNYHTLISILRSSKQVFDKNKKEFNLYLDFGPVFN